MEKLTIDLFEPGMGPLHRAGLGGLAATIRWLDDPEGGGKVAPELRPEGSASYDERTVTLSWEKPEDASDFLRRLYELSFDLEGGLIHLPGGYAGRSLNDDVKAALQAGMLQTILQHPKSKDKGKQADFTYEIDDKPITLTYNQIDWYKHQLAWKDLVTKKGGLRPRVAIAGTIAPGFVQRHADIPATSIEQPPGHAIALHFALVGTLSLSLGSKSGALIVPDVDDLIVFARRRFAATPPDPKGCQVASPADAALQAMVRLRAGKKRRAFGVSRCLAVLFTSQSWNEKQKTRAAVLDLEPGDQDLDRFQDATSFFPPRVAVGKPAKKGAEPVAFWAKSVVLPLVAENLAMGKPWFENFRDLVVGADGRADEARARSLGYEGEGLRQMIDQKWEDQGEERLVRAIHDAMRRTFGDIWGQEGVSEDGKKNRTNRQAQRWRLAFAGAKTPDDVRNALADMWSRATPNDVLKADWKAILPLLCEDRRWKLNRDLALLALASYPSRKDEEQAADDQEKADGEG